MVCCPYLQGEIEEELEEGLGRQPSKVSYGRGADGKIRRKGTVTHVRDSVRSSKSLKSRGAAAEAPNSDAPTSPLVKNTGTGGDGMQMEMVTVHEKNADEA